MKKKKKKLETETNQPRKGKKVRKKKKKKKLGFLARSFPQYFQNESRNLGENAHFFFFFLQAAQLLAYSASGVVVV